MELIKNYDAKLKTAKELRKIMPVIGQDIIRKKVGIMKKTKVFPLVLCESHFSKENGEWFFCCIAETKSRMKKGLFGMAAFKVYKDGKGRVDSILLVEGDDNGEVFLHEYLRSFLEEYAEAKGIEGSDIDDNTPKLFKSFFRENYFGFTKYSKIGFTRDGEDFVISPLLQCSPFGAANGVEGNIHGKHEKLFFKYYSSESLAEDEELYEEITDKCLDYFNDMNNNPWKYSPLKGKE